MDTSALNWLPIISALIGVASIVANVLIVRRGTDVELKGDVSELARLVDQMAKETRREKMRRVRAGQKGGFDPSEMVGGVEVPPELQNSPTPPLGALNDKAALRRAAFQLTRGGKR